MNAPRKPAARVMGLRPEADEMLLVTAEILKGESQYGKSWCFGLPNGSNCVLVLTVSKKLSAGLG